MEDGALRWFLFAEEYDIVPLRQACITFVAANYEALKTDQRLKLLPSATLVEVMNSLEIAKPRSGHGFCNYCRRW